MTSIWLSADLALFPSHEILSYPKTFRHTRSCLTPRPSDTRDSVLPQDLQSHEILSYPKTFSHTRFFLSQDLQSHEILSYPKTFSHTRFCLTPRPSVTRDSVLPQDLQSHEILSYPKTVLPGRRKRHQLMDFRSLAPVFHVH